MQPITTNQLMVLGVDRQGAKIAVNGENRNTTWDELRAAAAQSDEQLREVYQGLLAQAKRLAADRRELEVCVVSRTRGITYAAELYDVAGEFHSGRLVGADWGLTGTYAAAARDADEAIRDLSRRGYTICRGRDIDG